MLVRFILIIDILDTVSDLSKSNSEFKSTDQLNLVKIWLRSASFSIIISRLRKLISATDFSGEIP